jgi:hypothetical protein
MIRERGLYCCCVDQGKVVEAKSVMVCVFRDGMTDLVIIHTLR